MTSGDKRTATDAHTPNTEPIGGGACNHPGRQRHRGRNTRRRQSSTPSTHRRRAPKGCWSSPSPLAHQPRPGAAQEFFKVSPQTSTSPSSSSSTPSAGVESDTAMTNCKISLPETESSRRRLSSKSSTRLATMTLPGIVVPTTKLYPLTRAFCKAPTAPMHSRIKHRLMLQGLVASDAVRQPLLPPGVTEHNADTPALRESGLLT